jgi:hypothetical protein
MQPESSVDSPRRYVWADPVSYATGSWNRSGGTKDIVNRMHDNALGSVGSVQDVKVVCAAFQVLPLSRPLYCTPVLE